jgi:IS30 family transposase
MVVAEKLTDNWSPQQISGWLKVEYVNDPPMRVSHETIYKSLFVQELSPNLGDGRSQAAAV